MVTSNLLLDTRRRRDKRSIHELWPTGIAGIDRGPTANEGPRRAVVDQVDEFDS